MRKKGYHHTEETIKKMKNRTSFGMSGKHHTKETKTKMSESALEGFKNCRIPPMKKGGHHTSKTKGKISEYRKGKHHLLETKKKISESEKGKFVSKETGRKISEANKGENSHLWKGGISFEPYGIEFDSRLKNKIKKRDNYTCQLCRVTENLNVHHIDYNKKNSVESNLITLCCSCNGKVNFQRGFWTGYFSAVQQFKSYYEK